jgi:hypothetical protein
MNPAVPPLAKHWWEIETLLLFGISVRVFPTVLALIALWVGREIAKDPRRKLTSRQNVFLNVGLVIVTFLTVTGKLWGGQPLEVGWASVLGFGIGMNGIVIFEIFQRVTYNVFTGGNVTSKTVPLDSAADK